MCIYISIMDSKLYVFQLLKKIPTFDCMVAVSRV